MKHEMKLIEEIQKPGLGGKISHVTGNDTSGRHNTTVWVYTDTRELVLKWRKSAATAAAYSSPGHRPGNRFVIDIER